MERDSRPLKTDWTSGPWHAFDNGTCWQVNAEFDAVATTQFCYAPETEANARLIAAAPSLYEVLIAAEEELRLIRMKDTGVVYNPALRTQIALALALARGETNG